LRFRLVTPLVALAVVILAAGCSLSSHTAVPPPVNNGTVGESIVTTGALSVNNDKTSVVATLANARPGDSEVGTITVRNTGSANANLTVSHAVSGDKRLARLATVKVTGGAVVSVPGGAWSLDQLSKVTSIERNVKPGQSFTYHVVIRVPANAKGVTGKSATLTFRYTIVKAPGIATAN
jgi:hypothetical protein